jgi:hypothetical protein
LPAEQGAENMRTSMAYFAGAGTVIVAIVAGVGGGVMMADMVSPKSPKEMTLLERRMPAKPVQAADAPKPLQAADAPSEPVPYLAMSSPPAATPATTVAAAPAQPKAPTETTNAPTPAQPAETSQTRQAELPPKQAEVPAPQPAAQPVVREQAAAPDAAKARPGEVRRAEDRRKFERPQQWTERRRYKPHGEQELIAVEEKVREETEPRREFATEPIRIEMPQIRLFGPE